MADKRTKTGKELERRVADAYRAIGARRVEHDVELAGHQIDIYVELETSDRSLHRMAVEAKDYATPVGIKIVSDFSDIADRLRRERLIDEGVVVSSAGFSRPARNAAETYGLRLLEPADLDAMIAQAEAPTPIRTVLGRHLPHNLPPRSEFVGRETEKAHIRKAFRSRSYLISIDGIGGIGKTSLALEIAYECLRASRDKRPTDDITTFEGFIWTTAKDRDLTLNALFDTIGRVLEYPGIMQQPVKEKQITVQKLLQEKSYLLVVDNFETVTDDGVRDFLIELPEPSKALITTREQKLQEVRAISLKGLAKSEALALIRHEGERLGLKSLERAQDQMLSHLYEATGGAPLAIKWAVGQIKQRGQSLDAVLAALYEARGNIFDNIFARSWELLSPTAHHVLAVMPLFVTSASRAGIEAASDVHHFALDDALGQLIEMSLMDATDELNLARRRYNIHPLTRAFAEMKLQQESGIQDAARKRLADFYQSFTEEHGGWSKEGFPQLEPELRNISTVIQWCWEQRLTSLGMSIFFNISDFLIDRGYWSEAMTLGQQSLAMSTEPWDGINPEVFRVWPIGWLHRHRGELDLAEEQVAQALAVFEQLGEERNVALAKRNLGRIFYEQGKLKQAEQLLRDALAIYQHVQSPGDERLIHLVTANLAEVMLKKGDLDTAWALCDGVLESARQFGERFDKPERVSQLLSVLGDVARRRGDLGQAKMFWEEALGLMKQANRPDAIADGQFWLARIEIEMGETQTARQMLSDALETYRRLDIQSKVQEVEELLAELPEHSNHEGQADEN